MQVVIKLAEADVSVGALNALRFGLAALCFLPAASRGLRMPQLRGTALELGMWLFGASLAIFVCRSRLPEKTPFTSHKNILEVQKVHQKIPKKFPDSHHQKG